MRDAGIQQGDLLMVQRTKKIQNDQIAVLRLDNEIMVRRYRQHGRWKHRVKLVAEGAGVASVDVDTREQSLVVEGRAVGLVRKGFS